MGDKVKTLAVALCLLVLAPGQNSKPKSGGPFESREEREVKMAEQSILASIALGSSKARRSLCNQYKLACAGGDRAEVALALIGARRSPASLKALARSVRFSMDGALAEDYPCYVLEKGSAIKPYLTALKPGALYQQCASELEKIARGNNGLERPELKNVCSDPQTIKARISELQKGIDRNSKCAAGDF